MTLSTITKKVENLANNWEEFKKNNEQRLNEIEKKGSPDVLTIQNLNRLNSSLTKLSERISHMEVANIRNENYPILETKSAISAIGLNPYADEAKSLNHHKNQMIKSELAMEHKSAFNSYIRKGIETDLDQLETKALSVGSDTDGGYLVTSEMAEGIVAKIAEASAMRSLASVQEISTDALEIIEETGGTNASWASEETEVKDTKTPTINKKSIPVYEIFAQPKATQKLIDDASIDIELWLADKLAESFASLEGESFIKGDGVGKPRGILSYPAGTSHTEIEQIASGKKGIVEADSLIKLLYSLKSPYSKGATFLMNRQTIEQVRLLKESSTGQYLWNPGLALGAPNTLLGIPVVEDGNMPAPGDNSLSVALGNFKKAYQIVDRTGVRILRDPFTQKPYVKFYATKRLGADVINTSAIKLLRLGA